MTDNHIPRLWFLPEDRSFPYHTCKPSQPSVLCMLAQINAGFYLNMTCLLAPGNHADVAARIQGFLAIEAQIARTLGQTCVAVIRLAQRCVAHIQNSPKVISPIILPLFLREIYSAIPSGSSVSHWPNPSAVGSRSQPSSFHTIF